MLTEEFWICWWRHIFPPSWYPWSPSFPPFNEETFLGFSPLTLFSYQPKLILESDFKTKSQWLKRKKKISCVPNTNLLTWTIEIDKSSNIITGTGLCIKLQQMWEINHGSTLLWSWMLNWFLRSYVLKFWAKLRNQDALEYIFVWALGFEDLCDHLDLSWSHVRKF